MRFPKLEKRFEDAKKDLGEAVRTAFPVGTPVQVIEGSERTRRVLRGVVSQYGYDPLDVHFTLTSTGKHKSRRFSQVELD